MPSWWSLGRNKARIQGFSYRGEIKPLASISFAKPIRVLGYKPNIPGTHLGTGVKKQIASWIADEIGSYLSA
jgi:hypothetical protein